MEQLRIGLEWFLNPDHVPFLIGQTLGWFADAGLDVTLVAPDQHLDAMAAIESGALDIAITEPIHLVEDAARGRPTLGFARFLHTNGGVMYLERSGITRPRDLIGKRVQYPGAPGPGGLAIVSTMIEADGGVPSGLVPVNRGFHHVDALVDGDADVATLAFYNFEVVAARHGGHPAGFFALKDWGVPDFCQLVLVTSPDVFAARRAALERLLSVLSRGMDLLHQDPVRARSIYLQATDTAEHDPLLSAIFDATVPCFTFDLTLSTDYFDALSRWMAARGLIAAAPPTPWTNALALAPRR